jgi:hypothetical protein
MDTVDGEGADGLVFVAPRMQLEELAVTPLDLIRIDSPPHARSAAVAFVIEFDGFLPRGGFGDVGDGSAAVIARPRIDMDNCGGVSHQRSKLRREQSGDLPKRALNCDTVRYIGTAKERGREGNRYRVFGVPGSNRRQVPRCQPVSTELPLIRDAVIVQKKFEITLNCARRALASIGECMQANALILASGLKEG